ncbi:replication protein [Neobacillus sp.]|uniref:replication protein n=1 Tax=Neobacillus sp. TaxID=2675273 RepID=UPI00289FF941|nr:replication protein [Neobacillus sp.]
MSGIQNNEWFTKISNQSLEAIQRYKFTTNQLKIILVVWRYTYGYQREEHEFSLGFLESTTNLTRTRVSESLKGLIENKVLLEIQKGGGRKSKILSFNKNYDEWQIEKYSSTSLQNDTSRSLQNDTSRGLQDDTQYIKSKEMIKKKIYLDLPIQGSLFLKIYNQHFFNKYHKQHMMVSEKNHEVLLKEIERIEELTDHEEFEDIVYYHFANLPKDNNGNILAFIPAFQRYLEEIRSE